MFTTTRIYPMRASRNDRHDDDPSCVRSPMFRMTLVLLFVLATGEVEIDLKGFARGYYQARLVIDGKTIDACGFVKE